MLLLNADEMKSLDASAINDYHIPSLILMEHAALNVHDYICEKYAVNDKVVIVSGTGNNGADGLCLARLLYQTGFNPVVFLLGNESKLTKEARVHCDSLNSLGIKLYNISSQISGLTAEILVSEIALSSVVVDAIFGISLNREVTGIYSDVIAVINEYSNKIISLDIPSGVSADKGEVLGIAVKADVTITFAKPKVGLCLYQGAMYSGEVIVADIGIPKIAENKLKHPVKLINQECFERISYRNPFSHKGDFGKVLIVAGSRDMAGAATLAARSAYRAGSGLVYVLTHRDNKTAILANSPETIVYSYGDETTDGELALMLLDISKTVDSVVIGCGLSKSNSSKQLVSASFDIEKPILMDADALNIMAEDDRLLDQLKTRIYPTILTPHIGEMARLSKKTSQEISSDLLRTSKEFVEEYHVNLCLKSARTVVSFVSNKQFVNIKGNSGMATAGSGDVLSGTIGAMIAMNSEEYFEEAVLKGVYIHSVAGDKAAELRGEDSLIASDIIENL